MESLELQCQTLLKEAQKLWGRKQHLGAHHTEYLHGDVTETIHLNVFRSRNFNAPPSKPNHPWKLPDGFSQDLNTWRPPNSARRYQTNLMSKAIQDSSILST